MSPLWRLHLRPILRSAGPWLLLQPFLVPMAFSMPRGAELFEGQLVLLAALVAFGSQGGLSRERVEYLRQLPLGREEAERFAHFSALAVILCACVFSYFGEVTGAVRFFWRTLAWELLGHPPNEEPPSWEAHGFRWPWLNVLWLPVLAYWLVVVVLRRRRTSLREERLARSGMWLLFALVICGPIFLFLPARFGPPAVPEHDPWLRNLPGALAFLAVWPLSSWVRSRSERLGIDAHPVEEAAWES